MINTDKPKWLDDLNPTCQFCQSPSNHLAFIETLQKDGSILIEDYHFCTKCKQYNKTKTTDIHYKLFWDNTLSKRSKDPITGKPPLFDLQYGAKQ